ncbi:unnamed protein product [Parnassius apollo]|uniref:(apollo) hypothetical protein n=1 Tax=Parnassius apollo TaxID=110799 RepID=A0A8S3XX26_PARAO|nr:unnamed protein product [Parnassius apollo]
MANPTDKRFYQLTLAIQKAINAIETPVKEKHVRSTIIGTFQEQSAVTYWMVAIRQPLLDNRIVAWKFCHVTHKLLREGHPACLDDSQRHIGMIENLGKLWVHLREGYGRLVHLYCNLLVCKLKFHNRNPRFPGNMQLTADELDNIAENDVNNYFQICVELFDYMDDILNLQAAVFESLGNARANSMTASGQCRLAALIPCAQDASHIYDCNVRLLFRLHAALPPDTLAGHRERYPSSTSGSAALVRRTRRTSTTATCACCSACTPRCRLTRSPATARGTPPHSWQCCSCAQNASHIYDCNVRLLFRLHAALPPDILVGHRERYAPSTPGSAALVRRTRRTSTTATCACCSACTPRCRPTHSPTTARGTPQHSWQCCSCAQDASHIYDCNVRLLFRLHAALPPDTLAGHRERYAPSTPGSAALVRRTRRTSTTATCACCSACTPRCRPTHSPATARGTPPALLAVLLLCAGRVAHLRLQRAPAVPPARRAAVRHARRPPREVRPQHSWQCCSCAQDASHIYDCNVRLLFRLHAALPSDTLAGHRERYAPSTPGSAALVRRTRRTSTTATCACCSACTPRCRPTRSPATARGTPPALLAVLFLCAGRVAHLRLQRAPAVPPARRAAARHTRRPPREVRPQHSWQCCSRAQDASHIYDCNVRLLFRLHAALPPDTFAGHRERFRQQFKKLSSFYKHASSLQYYRNLLTLPVLPSNPPNFLIQSDFGTYVTPVVSIPEPPPDEVDSVGSLIDTSDTISQASHMSQMSRAESVERRATPSPQPDPVLERDRLIDHLQTELKRMRTEVSQLVQERNTMLGSMREHCTRLETQLQATKTELEEEKEKADTLAAETPEIKQKLVETEEKAKVIDEKFQKLKGAYTQLREEHITLIRQKAEVDKMASSLRAAAAQHENAKTMLQQQLNDRMKDVELLQQSASSSEEIEAYKSEISNLRTELENSRQKEVELQNLKASMETLEIEHKTATTEQQEKFLLMANELKEVKENLEKVQKEKEERDAVLNKTKEELLAIKQRNGEELKTVLREKEAAIQEIAELKQQYQQEKERLDQEVLVNQDLHIKFIEKDSEIKSTLIKLEEINVEFENKKADYDKKLMNQSAEIISLQEKIDECLQSKKCTEGLVEQLETDVSNIKIKLEKEINEKIKCQNAIKEKDLEITHLKNSIKEVDFNKNTALSELQDKNQEMFILEKNLTATIKEKDLEVENLRQLLIEKIDCHQAQTATLESLMNNISELKIIIANKDKQIAELSSKLDENLLCIEKGRKQFETLQNKYEIETSIMQEKLQHVSDSKEELIKNFKEIISEKDKQVIDLNIEVNKLSVEVSRLTEQLNEANAELEIGKNELLNLKDEYEHIISKNKANLDLKNNDLQTLNDEISKLSSEKKEIIAEKESIINELTNHKQALENRIKQKEETIEILNNNLYIMQNEKIEIENKLNDEIDQLKKEKKDFIHISETERKKVEDQNICYKQLLYAKDTTLGQVIKERDELMDQFAELEQLKIKEKDEMDVILSVKEKEYQMINARLEHTETERLTAECELQDLLQQNTVLEADVASLKAHLQEAQVEIKRQTSRLVTCASETALEVTNRALEAFEQASLRDTNRLAAELAEKALGELTRNTEINGNEETVAKSAIFAAHNTAQLSGYIMEICSVATDLELSDKLSNECRAMLSATKQCLESLRTGALEVSACEGARASVRAAAARVAAADAEPAARSVDDELASMDSAIEQAAAQIEEMLAASRAADSGVKLEVNEKILDACTTLMAAVKVLVQDARKLQNELGDPKTRQKMYRRNPQWSEGLISAAKAVVFAAKLLVSSADETVNGRGRVEGVSAAAHEVAGSTAQLVAASRARAPPAAPALARLAAASRHVAAAAGAVLAAARHAADLARDTEALDTSTLTLTATRRLEMESKVRTLELETALEAERMRLSELRKRHYQLAQLEENGNMTNGKE